MNIATSEVCRSRRRVRPSAIAALFATASLLSAAYAAPGGTSAAKLNIGDPAPLLQPARWLKGQPVAAFAKGHVYVVEFWATWCGPCKASIPHLTELARQYNGQADIIGVDIWESPDPTIKTLPKVEAFVKSQGDHMVYHIAADSTDNRIANAYMRSAGIDGIPTAFIVGKDGRIAWIGNPLLELDSVLPKVIAGTFDPVSARTRRDRQLGPMTAIQQAMAAKDYQGALKLIDTEIAANPKSEPGFTVLRFAALAHVDPAEFEKQARAKLVQSGDDIGIYNMVCSIPASDKDLAPEVYRFGRTLIGEALPRKDREYLFLAMGAEINSSLGDKQAAVQSATDAVKVAETDTHCSPEFLQFLRNNLVRFKTAAGG